jgi:16S rRNA pseudouridine516 synthase
MAFFTLQDILFSQGFGTRRVCAGLIQQGLVSVNGAVQTDTLADFDTEGLQFTVQGVHCGRTRTVLT